MSREGQTWNKAFVVKCASQHSRRCWATMSYEDPSVWLPSRNKLPPSGFLLRVDVSRKIYSSFNLSQELSQWPRLGSPTGGIDH
jgi:hypothetical protein